MRTENIYGSSREHLQAELALIDLLIKRQILILHLNNERAKNCDEFSGMYVSTEEINSYLAGPEIGPAPDADRHEAVQNHTRKFLEYRTLIEARAQASLRDGVELRLVQLRERFRLTRQEAGLLMACLAPDLDMRFERYFAYLQNDMAKKRPTVQLLEKLLNEGNGAADVRTLLSPEGALVKNQILTVQKPNNGDDAPFPACQPRLSYSVMNWLFTIDLLDPMLTGIAEIVAPSVPDMSAGYYRNSYYNNHLTIAQSCAGYIERNAYLPLMYLAGPRGTGKTMLVDYLADRMEKKVIRVNCAKLLYGQQDLAGLLQIMNREMTLHNAILHLHDSDTLLESHEGEKHRFGMFLETLREHSDAAIIITGTKRHEAIKNVFNIARLNYYIPLPSLEERFELWKTVLHCSSSEAENRLLGELAAKFRFSPGQVTSVVKAALDEAGVRENSGDTLSLDDIYRHCRLESNQGLLAFAKKITPRYGWDDIILPSDTESHLREICNCVKNRRRVYAEWGFDSKFSLGKGLNILFSGPPGTGKTMSAEIIAKDLDLDLYKVDLSRVVSKYIGETEKNLSKIFQEAETSNSIMFFDEADAIFGKRTEIKDSHDRYANLEISFILQKIEEHEGVVILASNYMKNVDSAFVRRLHHVVEFPFPDELQRTRIWGKVFPDATPLSDDIDTAFLAGRFKLAGGHIKNIAVSSSFLAATSGGIVTMDHLILAMKREYQKLGKLCSKSDFGQYYHLVAEELEHERV